jgi:hypothetical protein
LNVILVQIAILFLPGLVWARLDARYGTTEKPSETELFIRAFMYGLATYAVVYIIYWCVGREFSILEMNDVEESVVLTADFIDEIIFSIPVSFFLSIIWIAANTHKWLTRALQHLRITNKFGDEDVWDFTFNSSQAAVEYVHVRDFDKNLTYAGWVNIFSETGKLRELVLRDVIVYDSEGNETEIPLLYIARDPADIHIEFPYREEEK